MSPTWQDQHAQALHAIVAVLEQYALGDGSEPGLEPVSGGDINRSFRVSFADRTTPLFAKFNDADHQGILISEYASLKYFARHKTCHYPQPLACEVVDGFAILLMSWHSLIRPNETQAAMLGRALAEQHRITGDRFGWQANNFIGLTPQYNDELEHWPDFYWRCRIKPQLEWAAQRGLPQHLQTQIQRLPERWGYLFQSYQPVASLLHGDLWGGNAAFDELSGRPLLYDPAPYFGDRETDLAMTELFGDFSGSFYQAYNAQWPLDPGYQSRKALYQLYHALNHFNLFGNAYQSMVESLLVELAEST